MAIGGRYRLRRPHKPAEGIPFIELPRLQPHRPNLDEPGLRGIESGRLGVEHDGVQSDQRRCIAERHGTLAGPAIATTQVWPSVAVFASRGAVGQPQIILALAAPPRFYPPPSHLIPILDLHANHHRSAVLPTRHSG